MKGVTFMFTLYNNKSNDIIINFFFSFLSVRSFTTFGGLIQFGILHKIFVATGVYSAGFANLFSNIKQPTLIPTQYL